MRIAIYHNLPSGGALRTLHEAARRLHGRHQLSLYSLSSANHDFVDLRPYLTSRHVYPFQPSPLLGSPFGRLNQALRLADLSRLDRLARRIANDIAAEAHDVVLLEPCQFEKAPSLLRYLQGRVPTVYFCQETLRTLYEPEPSRPYTGDSSRRRQMLNAVDPLRALYLKQLKQADLSNIRSAHSVLVNSEFMRQVVASAYGLEAQVSYHGIDTELFRPLGLPRQELLFSVGSLTPLKSFDFLIQSAAHIPASRRPPLLIASNFQNAAERTYLLALAADLGVELRLLGNISDEQLVRLYNQAALTVYAPLREPFGLVPLESLACGTPVVTVREGGMLETITHGETGLLTERDPMEFAQAAMSLLADPDMAYRMGGSGREQVLGRWTWDRAVSSLEAHLSRSAQN